LRRVLLNLSLLLDSSRILDGVELGLEPGVDVLDLL
jgi:hypothetical protein